MPKKTTSRTQPKPRRGWARASDVGLALLALLVVAGVVAVVINRPDAPVSSLRALPSPSPSVERVDALFFGDSITEGCCRSEASSPSMAVTARTLLGWDADVRGLGSTGYLAAGATEFARVPYAERISSAAGAADYDVIVLQGSGNDDQVGTEAQLASAFEDVVDKARVAAPGAKIIVLGPYAPGGRPYLRERRVLGARSAALGLPFIDPVEAGWMDNRPDLISDDGFHPNDAGQAHLGRLLAAELRKLVTARSGPA